MRGWLLLIALGAACARQPLPPSTPPLPSTPPPPPPQRVVPTAAVSGSVLNASGVAVPHASVLARAADANCRPLSFEVGAVTDERGEFIAVVEGNELARCVIVEATGGGATGFASTPAEFAIASPRLRADVRLDRGPRLTQAEAERLVHLLAGAINDPARASADLGTYVLHGPEALRVALDQYRTLLGRVARIEALPVASWEGHRFRYALQGANGRALTVDVFQEDLIRMHSVLLDYGFRSERFINAYLRAIQRGDAEMLSRVMNPDDIDFPVEKAREMIVDYRLRFGDTARIRPEFVDVDETRNSITWRLREGDVVETVILGFGDGLIGVREIRK